MEYLCLAYYDEQKFDGLSKAEVHAIVSQCPPLDEALRNSGRLIAQAFVEYGSEEIRCRAAESAESD